MEKKMVIALAIAFLMISSIFGFVLDYAFSPSATKLEYNGVKFTFVNNQYNAKVNGVERVFLFFPGELVSINLSDSVKSLLQKPVLTVTYDPSSNLSQNFGEAQYYVELQLGDDKTIERSLMNNTNTQLSQRSCADATENQPVIQFQQGNSEIKAENNCIIVSSYDAYDVYQQTERLVYQMLGVMS